MPHTYKNDPLKRFSNRVDNYIKYRPKYPPTVLEFLNDTLKLKPNDKIADVGSGTGILSELLLNNKNTVYAVEPNKDMREAAEKLLNSYNNFKSVDGAAESTGLPAGSIDIVTSAQAFHWFNHETAKIEFKRILRDNGWVVLLWNSRVINSNRFMIAYENFLLKFASDYTEVNHTNINKNIFENFFSKYESVQFPNMQSFDFEGLKGRLLSSSYVPDESSSTYIPMINALTALFHEFESSGKVDFIYNTEIYYGKL
jgi:ubiquinone/menaquinone biosynthesis C-methylase UbiE